MGLLAAAAWMLLGIAGMATIHTVIGAVMLFLVLAGAFGGYCLIRRGSTPFTQTRVFFASRFAKDNLIFPTQVAVLPTQVVRHKARIIGAEEETINISQIASVKIITGFLWSDVIIESTGGANSIICHGHLNADAKAIEQLIQQYQGQHYGQQAAPPARPGSPGTAAGSGVLILSLFSPSPGHPPTLQDEPIPISRHRCPLPVAPGSAPLETLIPDMLRHGPPGSVLHITHIPGPSPPSPE